MSAAHTVIELAGRKITVDLPHLAFATAIAAWSTWFCWDSWHASPDIENLILIVPGTVAAVILYGFVAAGCFRLANGARTQEMSPREPLVAGLGVKIAGSMALLAAFAFAGPLIGFDVASFVYMLAMMAFLGERRITVLLLVSLVFCVAVIYSFNVFLATPLPLFFFSGCAS